MKGYQPGLDDLRAMLARGREKLVVAQKEFEMGFANDSASRAYYAAYQAVYAVLAHHGLTFSSHAQLIGALTAIS